MSQYRKILIAVDLDEVSDQVVAKGVELAGDGVNVSLVHVIEPIPIQGPIPAIDYDHIYQYSENQARSRLAELGERYGIKEERRSLLSGAAKKAIQQYAEDHDVDLIVLGSHGRQGVSLLLGSTANAVLHGANCDVLAIRV